MEKWAQGLKGPFWEEEMVLEAHQISETEAFDSCKNSQYLILYQYLHCSGY